MDIIITLVVIIGLSLLFIKRFSLNAAMAPFASISAAVLTLILFGVFNLMIVGVVAVYAAAAFGLWYALWCKRDELRTTAAQFFTPGMVFFLVCFAFFGIYLAIKSPHFVVWDEFSFWGIAAKTVFQHRKLYTLFESSMVGVSYPPALPVLGYFVQCTGSTFGEWKVFFAYDMLMMSVFAMLFARFKFKNYIALPVLGTASVLGLYMFYNSFEDLVLFCNSYSDVPLGVVFGAALAAWFCGELSGGMQRYYVVLLALALETMTKDTGLAFALVAAAVIAFDMVISGQYPADALPPFKKKASRLGFAALMFVTVIVTYLVWSVHLSAAVSIERNSVPYEYGIIDMLSGNDEYFNEICRRMIAALSSEKLTTFGNVTTMLIVFTALPIVLAPFCAKKKNSARLVVNALLLLVGFALYYLFMAYIYTAVFHSSEYALSSYNRYISSYAIGWFIALLAMACGEISRPRLPKADTLPAVALGALVVVSMIYYSPVALSEYLKTSDEKAPDLVGLREYFMTAAEKFGSELGADDKIYFVCQGSQGGEWFYFNFDFQPCYTISTLGGGNFVQKGSQHDGIYDIEVDADDFAEYLTEQGADYVYIMRADDFFHEEFAPLFSDAMMGYYDGTVNMYKVVHEGGELSLVSCANANTVRALRERYGY